MFASQLLRILQTIPSDVKNESCVYDSAKQDMTMKENENATLYDSRSFGREADSLDFGSNEIYQSNSLRRNADPLEFEVKGRDECWKPKFVDDFSTDNQNGTRDSTGEEFQNGFLCRPSSLEEDTDSLSSDTNAKDNVQNSPEHEQFTHLNENESNDSRLPYIASSDLLERDTNLCADKNVLECGSPELIVCYKEINYHVVKDICVDQGMPVNDKVLIQSSEDDQSGHSSPKSLNDDGHCEATEGSLDMELFTSDGLSAELLDQENPKLPSESSSDQDTAKHFGPENPMQKGETNFGATGKSVTDASEVDSFIDRTLPIQEFGTRSFLRSFLNSLDGEGNEVPQLPDQISSTKAASEAGPKEDVQASSLYYNSNVENGSITFNFNSPAPVVTNVTNGRTENVKKQSVDSRDLLDHNNVNADIDSLSYPRQVHPSSSKETSIGKVHEQSPNHKNENLEDISSDVQLQLPSSKSVNSINSDNQAVELHVLKHEHKDSRNDTVDSQGKYDQGELSFSAAGLITCSGPIAYPGSVSFRSDGSATSGRSFAFPILQSEWTNSPVRMTKADGRDFRKHKSWRSGLLCCRF